MTTTLESPAVDPLDHQRLVWKIAIRYRGRGVDVDDLVQEGQFGLLRAAEGFDPERKCKFSTYATPWIKQAMRTAIRNQAGTVRIPAYIHEALTAGQTPESPEVPLKRRACLKAALEVRGRRTVGSGDLTEAGLEELVVDHRGCGQLDREELHRVVRAIVALPPPLRRVLRLRFGLYGHEPLTQVAIADRLGVTKQRAHQMEHEAIAELKKRLREAA